MIQDLVESQRAYFQSGKTLSYDARMAALRKLEQVIQEQEMAIGNALQADLNKSQMESYMTEIGIVYDELHFQMKHLRKWMKPKKVRTPLTQFYAKSFVLAEPYGVCLVMAPWNYPFLLSIEPLIGAIAAGNCVVLKPSAYAPNTSRVLREIVQAAFDPTLAVVVEGGREENTALLEQHFDYIFFTGGTKVGRLVMEKAAKNLTPITLELGGKSPCIVDEKADVDMAAKRIVFGKYINSGQTCIAPDYVLASEKIVDSLCESLKKWVDAFYPASSFATYPHMINEKHFTRVMNLIEGEEILVGGKADREQLRIDPTILTHVSWESPVMQEEIFGPVLPILTYDRLDDALDKIKARPKPLALYLFTADRAVEEHVLSTVSFGGGCVNDTIMHIATPYMGFGGVGESGMGSYHGRKSFETFTHEKSIMRRSTAIDISLRYRPYTDKSYRWLKKLLG